jgi:hypothetical protein
MQERSAGWSGLRWSVRQRVRLELVAALAAAAALGAAGCGAKSKGAPSCTGAACAQAGTGSKPDAAQPLLDAGHDAAVSPVDAGAAPIAPRGPAPSPKACIPDGPAASALGSARSVLFMGARKLSALAATPSALFVIDDDAGIFRLATGSSTLERVVAVKALPEFLAADLHLYWFDNSSIWKTSLTATDATPELVGGGLPHRASRMNFDKTNLYFADLEASAVLRLPLAGGAPVTLVSGVSATDLELRAGSLYYADSKTQQAYRVSITAGSKPELLTSGSNFSVAAVEADTTTLYWADGGEIRSTPIGKPAMQKPIGRGGPGPAGMGVGLVSRLLLVAGRLYFVDDGGNVGWTMPDGSSCGLLVKGAGTIRGFDADDSAVYLSIGAGASSELWRVTHP